MAKQTINPGTAPTGAGGDTFRSGSAKLQANDDELYVFLGGTGAGNGTLPSSLPLNKGGTGATTAAGARTALGLGTAAVATTGNAVNQIPVMAASGLGGNGYMIGYLPSNQYATWSDVPKVAGWFKIADGVSATTGVPGRNGIYGNYGMYFPRHSPGFGAALFFPYSTGSKALTLRIIPGDLDYTIYHSGDPVVFTTAKAESSGRIVTVESTGELRSRGFTVDGNGFYKSASPIVQLLADRIELNEEAKQQDIIFEKLETGDYLIKGSSGFAQEGWYVETPKDANGNVLFSVLYDTLENGDISVKTYKKKFDLETASIIADLNKPVDITEGRWIDLRLQELPQTEIEVVDEPK